MAKKSKRVVPPVLWRRYGKSSRTLSETITSLIPPSSSVEECSGCKGRKCVGCCGKDFLLRPEDPDDYQKLLKKCFVVVPDNAPPLLGYFSDCRWPLHETICRAIEMMMLEKQRPPNALCYGFDKAKRSSTPIMLLTSSAWVLLSRRVGDVVMVHLLKYTSIFLPLPRMKFHQVAGFPMSELCFRYPKHRSDPGIQQCSHALGSSKKRKRFEDDSRSDKPNFAVSSIDNLPSNSSSCFGCIGRSYLTLYGRPRMKMHCKTSLHGDDVETTGVVYANNEGISSRGCQGSSTQSVGNSRKRSRQPLWKRQKKRRLQNSVCKSFSVLHMKMPFPCYCCSVFQTLKKVSKAQIDRQSIFYKLGNSLTVFPRRNILNSLNPNIHDANVIFKSIFNLSDDNITFQSVPCVHSNNCCLAGSKCLYHSLLKLFKVLIRKAQLCKHKLLLEKHCAVPSFHQNANENNCSSSGVNLSETNPLVKVKDGVELPGNLLAEKSDCLNERTPKGTATRSEQSKSYCTNHQVVSFIWAVCKNIIPPDLLGTPKAQRALLRNISKFIGLRRFEKISLRQCLHKLKLSNFPLLSNKHSLCYMNNHFEKNSKGHNGDLGNSDANHFLKQRILERWILWLYSDIVLPLVRANFYVTESQHGKQEVFYYRQSIWDKLMNRGVTCLKDLNYLLLDDASVKNIICKRPFGFSKVRLLPKSSGVRPIANLKAPSRLRVSSLSSRNFNYHKFLPANVVLQDLHAVLKGIQLEEPQKLGSSVFDYNDVYKKIRSFLSVLKNGTNTMPGTPGLFIVVADVSKAFDSVDQEKLLSVMKEVILCDNYLLQKFHKVVCTKKSLQVSENIIFAHQVFPTKSATAFPIRSSNCVLVNKEWRRNLTKKELFSTLTQHVTQNVLQLDREFYLQNVGIPQGSILSSLLCSFYYGDMENNVLFPYLGKICEPGNEYLLKSLDCSDSPNAANRCLDESSVPPKYTLLRFIDDFLFISNSRKLAEGFSSRLKRGFREYNCHMNEEKFGLYFDGQRSMSESSRFFEGEDGASFLLWSGLLINCRTLEVQADYTRYLNSHLSSTLTVCWQGKLANTLKAKLYDYLRPKCHPIFYDSNVNSATVVRLNIYQAFLICAMKFHCYVRDLSGICRLKPESYMAIICSSLRYMSNLIYTRMYTMPHDSKFQPVLKVKKSEISWLGSVAFIKVLMRKQTRHKELLSLLEAKLLKNDMTRSASSSLEDAVKDSKSSFIWKIRY